MSPKSIYRGGGPRNHVECDGDDMAVHNVGGPERRANAPLAQLVRAQHS